MMKISVLFENDSIPSNLNETTCLFLPMQLSFPPSSQPLSFSTVHWKKQGYKFVKSFFFFSINSNKDIKYVD